MIKSLTAVTALMLCATTAAAQPCSLTNIFQSTTGLSAASNAEGFALADLNNDGASDVIVTPSSGLNVFFNNGDATFGPAQTIPVGNRPVGTQAADLNGDNFADIVVANALSLNVGVLIIYNGDGTSHPRPPFPPGSPRSNSRSTITTATATSTSPLPTKAPAAPSP